MNILITVHHFPPVYTGGAEWRAYRTAKSLQKRGHSVSVVCVEKIDHQSKNDLEWKDDEFNGIPVRRLFFNLSAAPNTFTWRYNNPWIGENVRQILKEKNIDILHLISGYLISSSVLEIARQENVKTVLSLTDFWFLCPRISMINSQNKISELPITPQRCAQCLGEEKRRYRWPGKIFPGLMQFYWSNQTAEIEQMRERQKHLLKQFAAIDAVISPSRFLKKFHEQAGALNQGMIFSRQGYEFLENPDNLPEKIKSEHVRLGYIGQFVWKKGVHVIIKALKLLPDAPLTLKLYGNSNAFPDYSDDLANLAENDPRIHWEGVFPHENISTIFQDLDMIIVPSIWYENSPNVILEAFAHQTPVMASNLGGMAELVKEQVNGLLFKAGDEVDLARQIKKVIENPAMIDQLSQGIEPVKSLEQEIDEIEKVYNSIIAVKAF
jgi:glycosyltransferase involved in cell wall biosynthesis